MRAASADQAGVGARSGLPQSVVAAEGPFNRSNVQHNSQYVRTVNNAPVTMRDFRGNPLLNTNSQPITVVPKHRSQCPGGSSAAPCLRFQGIERTVTSSGMTLYYSWEWDSASGDRPGFVWLYELASRPATDIAFAAGNGSDPNDPQNPPPAYTITPYDISQNQGYLGVNTGSSYTYAPYGIPGGGMMSALMSWSWIDVGAGGIARTILPANERFYPATNVAPITTPSYAFNGFTSPLGGENGTVTVRYGHVRDGTKKIFGWVTTKHTYGSTCVNHMTYADGGPALSDTLCPAPSPPPPALAPTI